MNFGQDTNGASSPGNFFANMIEGVLSGGAQDASSFKGSPMIGGASISSDEFFERLSKSPDEGLDKAVGLNIEGPALNHATGAYKDKLMKRNSQSMER